MKQLLFSMLLVTGGTTYAQVITPKEPLSSVSTTTPETYHYEFKINGITNPAEAKEITDDLRSIFNTPENRFQYFPRFSDDQDMFVFNSSIKVEHELLAQKIQAIGYTVMAFTTSTLPQ